MRLLDTLKLRASIYADGGIITSNAIYQVPLRKSTQLRLDDLHIWQIPDDSRPGTYGIALELIDVNGITQDTEILTFEVIKNPKILNYSIDLSSLDSLEFDISKSADDTSDKRKDAYVHLNLPNEASRLSITMNVEPDDNINLVLFSPDGSVAVNSTKGKGASENVSIADPRKGDWKLHVSAFKIAGPSALVSMKFDLESDNQVSIMSTNMSSPLYTKDEKASILMDIKNLGSSQKILGMRYEIIDSDGTLKQVNYGITSVKADSEKTVRKSIILKGLPAGSYFSRSLIYDVKSFENYSQELSSFSIAPTTNERVTVRIDHPHIGDLDVLLGIFGDKEIVIKGHDMSDDSTSVAINKDVSELDLDISKHGSLMYVKVLDIAKGNEGVVTYASLESNDNFYEYTDETQIKDLSTTIIPLFNLDSMFYVRSSTDDASELALQFVSLADSVEQAFSNIFYQKVFQNLLSMNATANVSMNNCVLTRPSLPAVPVLCLNMEAANSTLTKTITLRTSAIASDFDVNVFTLMEPSFLASVNEVLNDGLTLVSADDNFYDLYFNARHLDRALLPQYIDVLRGKASLNLMYGVDTSGTIEQTATAVSNYLSSNTKDVKKVAAFVAKGINKSAISPLLHASSEMLSKNLGNQFAKWVEYYRALQVIQERKVMDEKFNTPRDVAVAYAKDYVDRHSHVTDLVAPDGFDQVLSNVQMDDGASKIFLDLVYVKHDKVIGVIKIDSELRDTSSILKEDLSKIIEELVADKGEKIVSISHGLAVEQFDLLNDKRVLTVGMANGDAEFDIKLPLTNNELRQVLNQTR
jgi:hypothetical protein